MRAEDLFQYLAEVLYVVIFAAVALRALRRLTHVRLDVLLFFGDAAIIVVFAEALKLLGITPGALINDLEAALLMALPYLLLRLVRDFMDVPAWLMRGAEVGLIASVIAIVGFTPSLPVPVTLLIIAYFVGFTVYASIAFLRGSRRSRGVTRRRLEASALGSIFLGLDILIVGLGVGMPAQAALWGALGPLAGMGSGIAYFIGFAPPTWLRRAWQEPELRAFLGRAAALPHLPDMPTIVSELERGAADAAGGSGATIALLNDGSDTLQPTGVPARVVREQRAYLVEDVAAEDPVNAELYAEHGAKAALAAPIVAGGESLGVLVVYAPRAPMFADSDLELVQLLADQAAVVLENRKLLEVVASTQARIEAARMKEDFLSSAAHDLKTPITGILTQAQVVERRLTQRVNDPLVPVGVSRIVSEARRLSALVLELLDVSLLERGQLVTTREAVDLVDLAAAICARHTNARVQCRVSASDSVIAVADPIRMRQLMDHLIDNAIKFSPVGAEVTVRLWREGSEARVEVQDSGIGVPVQDLPRLFERFHRGSNVDDRRFAGLGLGLYLSRGIVEQHGGRIWAESNAGVGTTLSVALPINGPVTSASPVEFASGL